MACYYFINLNFVFKLWHKHEYINFHDNFIKYPYIYPPNTPLITNVLMNRQRKRDSKVSANIFHPFPSLLDPNVSYWAEHKNKHKHYIYIKHTSHMNLTTQQPQQLRNLDGLRWNQQNRSSKAPRHGIAIVCFRLPRQRAAGTGSRPLRPPQRESQHVCAAGALKARQVPTGAPGG